MPGCYLCILYLVQDKHVGIFLTPVPVNEVPDYLEIIAEPMDLLTVWTRLKNGIKLPA